MIVARIHRDYSFRGWRAKPRRAMRLEVEAKDGSDGDYATVRDLSEHGLRIDTEADLQVGDQFEVVFPMGGQYAAEVIWVHGPARGCKFLDPIPKSEVSAAALLSPIEQTEPQPEAAAGAMDQFLDDTRPEPTDMIWYVARAAVFALLMAALLFIAGMLKSAIG